MPREVFISHRHADARIADVLRMNMKSWSSELEISQSSNPAKGVLPGKDLQSEITNSLTACQLFILIYTNPEDDWSYCLWETGVASSQGQGNESRLVILQCTDESPTIFRDTVRLKVDQHGIRDFVNQLMRRDDFFPKLPALRPDVSDDVLNRMSEKLHVELIAVVPQGRKQHRQLCDAITLKISPDDYRQINMEEPSSAAEIVLCGSRVYSSNGNAISHFGFATQAEGTSLKDLLIRWRSEVEKPMFEWSNHLLDQIVRALQNRPLVVVDPACFQSVSPIRVAWLLATVHSVIVRADGGAEVEVCLYPIGSRLPDSSRTSNV